MTHSYTRLEEAILVAMKAHLEESVRRGGLGSPAGRSYHNAFKREIHSLINNTVPCTPEELAITMEMLTYEGLLRERFNESTGDEDGHHITKDGLIAVRSFRYL
jgi:hypothetical protein